MNVRTVVYTAMYGHYTQLHPIPDMGCDCIAFVDDPSTPPTEGWKIQPVWSPQTHPRMQAKYFKMHPHVLFPEHDISIWIDASVKVENPAFVREAAEYLENFEMMLFRHSSRTNIDEELAAHLRLPKYADIAEALKLQVEQYHTMGFRQEGLFECTCVVRRHNRMDIKRFDTRWWEENVSRSYADQLSCPFVLWQEKIESMGLFPFTLYDPAQKWFKILGQRADI